MKEADPKNNTKIKQNLGISCLNTKNEITEINDIKPRMNEKVYNSSTNSSNFTKIEINNHANDFFKKIFDTNAHDTQSQTASYKTEKIENLKNKEDLKNHNTNEKFEKITNKVNSIDDVKSGLKNQFSNSKSVLNLILENDTKKYKNNAIKTDSNGSSNIQLIKNDLNDADRNLNKNSNNNDSSKRFNSFKSNFFNQVLYNTEHKNENDSNKFNIQIENKDKYSSLKLSKTEKISTLKNDEKIMNKVENINQIASMNIDETNNINANKRQVINKDCKFSKHKNLFDSKRFNVTNNNYTQHRNNNENNYIEKLNLNQIDKSKNNMNIYKHNNINNTEEKQKNYLYENFKNLHNNNQIIDNYNKDYDSENNFIYINDSYDNYDYDSSKKCDFTNQNFNNQNNKNYVHHYNNKNDNDDQKDINYHSESFNDFSEHLELVNVKNSDENLNIGNNINKSNLMKNDKSLYIKDETYVDNQQTDNNSMDFTTKYLNKHICAKFNNNDSKNDEYNEFDKFSMNNYNKKSMNEVNKDNTISLNKKEPDSLNNIDFKLAQLSSWNNDALNKINILKSKLGKIPNIKGSFDKLILLKSKIFETLLSYYSNEDIHSLFVCNRKIRMKIQEIMTFKANTIMNLFINKYKHFFDLLSCSLVINRYNKKCDNYLTENDKKFDNLKGNVQNVDYLNDVKPKSKIYF